MYKRLWGRISLRTPANTSTAVPRKAAGNMGFTTVLTKKAPPPQGALSFFQLWASSRSMMARMESKEGCT